VHGWNASFINRGIKEGMYKVMVQSALLYGCAHMKLGQFLTGNYLGLGFQLRCLRSTWGFNPLRQGAEC
jgi:hypothetical protein